MGAAVRRRDGVAIGRREAVIAAEPGHRPFHRAVAVFLLGFSSEDFINNAGLAFQPFGEKVLQPAGEMQHGLVRRVLVLDERRIAAPADFNTAEEIGFGARHLVKSAAEERGVALAENLLVRVEAHRGATAARDLAQIFQPGDRLAAPEFLAVKRLPARHLDHHMVGKRVDHRDTDTMQAAGGFIGTAIEFAAGMQRGHDDLKRHLVLELGMWIDGDATAIVGH